MRISKSHKACICYSRLLIMPSPIGR